MTTQTPGGAGGGRRGGGDGLKLLGRVLSGRFQIEAVLGRGGSAIVYAARDRHLRRRVAVKVILPEHGREPEQRQRILQEARIASAFDHPNLVPLLDHGEHREPTGEHLLYLVMPLLQGRTLRGVVLGGGLPWVDAIHLVRQILAGVAELHRAGVLHRDLKASNCLVVRRAGRDHLRILDFGLAKITRGGVEAELDLMTIPPITRQGALRGTLVYAAPEQICDHPVDTRTDLYAVGVILYELLTRHLPFTGCEYEVIRAIVERPPRPPSSYSAAAAIPERLNKLVLRALAKRPSERLASAEEFDRALVAILHAEGLPEIAPVRPPGTDEARESLAAWTCFEYARARALSKRAKTLDHAWSPLALLMSLTLEDE